MRIRSLALAGVLASLSITTAYAAPSGGGGGGEMPSASGPTYDPAAEYAKAITALQAKDYKAAARAAQRVTDAVPKSVDGWRVLGLAQSGATNWKGARRAYEKAVKLAPDDVLLHAGLAVALANLKDAKAQEEAAWLKARAQTCAERCAEASTLMKAIGEVDAAISNQAAPKPAAALESSLLFASTASGDAAYLQAVGLINETRYDEALAALGTAQKAFGPHPDILTYQGYAWRKKGAYDVAEGYYRQALAIAPAHRGATEYYGELKVERGDLAGARVLLTRLDRICRFGCAEAEELRRWVDAGAAKSQ
jgi:Flp pilus assembly protein TadD